MGFWGATKGRGLRHSITQHMITGEVQSCRTLIDLLALQDVIVEAQVGYGQLEHPVVLGRVLLEDGTWRRGGVKAIGLEGASSPPHPYPSLGPLVTVLAGLQVARWWDFWAAVSA